MFRSANLDYCNEHDAGQQLIWDEAYKMQLYDPKMQGKKAKIILYLYHIVKKLYQLTMSLISHKVQYTR